MATTIKIKRSTGTSAPSSLNAGELAYTGGAGTSGNTGSRLFIGNPADGTNLIIGGKYFTDLFSTSANGTIVANKVVTVDGSKKVNEWKVDNLTLDGSTISSTGSLILTHGGTIDLSAQANEFALLDNSSAALEIKEGSNSYLKFVTTNSAEKIIAGKKLIVDGDCTTGNGGVSISNGFIDLMNGGSLSKIKFYCESANAHAQTLQAAAHSLSATNTLSLPHVGTILATTDGAQTLTNKTFDLGGTGNSLTGSLAEFNSALQGDSFMTLADTQTLTNKTFTTPTITSGVFNTGVSGSAFKDEDNMASDSATAVASQQSIKAYVLATIDAQDVDIAADSGSNIAVDLDDEVLTIAGGTSIASTTGTNSVTLAIESSVATLTGSQTFEDKTFTSPLINALTFASGQSTSGLNIGANGIIFEGASADAHETTFRVDEPTADRKASLQDKTGTIALLSGFRIDATDSSASNEGDFIVLDTSADENDRLLFEDGTSDPIAVLASHGITLSGQGWNAFQFENP